MCYVWYIHFKNIVGAVIVVVVVHFVPNIIHVCNIHSFNIYLGGCVQKGRNILQKKTRRIMCGIDILCELNSVSECDVSTHLFYVFFLYTHNIYNQKCSCTYNTRLKREDTLFYLFILVPCLYSKYDVM